VDYAVMAWGYVKVRMGLPRGLCRHGLGLCQGKNGSPSWTMPSWPGAMSR
jgi:hypothetical protein